MSKFIQICLFWVSSRLNIVANLATENLALRQQINVLTRNQKRPKLKERDRLFWMILSRVWSGWRSAVVIVQSDTVVRWHKRAFKLYWRRTSRSVKRGRPAVVYFNVTANPTAEWTAQQVIEAFPWDTAPQYLLRDRDSIYGGWFRQRVQRIGIEQVVTDCKSPWQNAYVERLNGTIRRECTDHVIVFSENHLRRILRAYFEYYHEDRTHLGLGKETPKERPISNKASPNARPVELPRVGGLHHRYKWSEAA